MYVQETARMRKREKEKNKFHLQTSVDSTRDAGKRSSVSVIVQV